MVAQGGTSISWFSLGVGVSTSGLLIGVEHDPGFGGGLGTLLGPEGAGNRFVSAGTLGDWGVVVRLGLTRHYNALVGFGLGVWLVAMWGWFCP